MLEVIGGLAGTLSAITSLSGELSGIEGLSGELSVFNGEYIPYTGPNVVEPGFDDVKLETKNKYMTDDVTVKQIQVESVSNLSGGRTVYIGGII